jgi:hypothetical protein
MRTVASANDDLHHHAGHVHVDRKINIGNIDKLPFGVAKLDQGIVVAF